MSKIQCLNTVANQSIVKSSVRNVKPILETRKIRKFRATYKVPLVLALDRQEGKAILVITQAFKSNPVHSFSVYQISCFITKTMNSLIPKVDEFSNHLNHRFYKKKDKANKNSTSSVDAYLTNFYKRYSIGGQSNQDKMIEKLSQTLFSAFYRKVEILDKRKIDSQDALKNRAYLNIRWW
uniref:30S ribosomal protein S7 n=1 Tax=Jaagichlorella hainangensis TaxID=445995 RepID=A0A6M8UDT5_9CHLO|nr:30S ribosomal protein S7 [Jaagichlorella hainangensis]QKJ84922.1 30S ribosomal protein S7 [Jaagichlorella hainangensis]